MFETAKEIASSFKYSIPKDDLFIYSTVEYKIRKTIIESPFPMGRWKEMITETIYLFNLFQLQKTSKPDSKIENEKKAKKQLKKIKPIIKFTQVSRSQFTKEEYPSKPLIQAKLSGELPSDFKAKYLKKLLKQVGIKVDKSKTVGTTFISSNIGITRLLEQENTPIGIWGRNSKTGNFELVGISKILYTGDSFFYDLENKYLLNYNIHGQLEIFKRNDNGRLTRVHYIENFKDFFINTPFDTNNLIPSLTYTGVLIFKAQGVDGIAEYLRKEF